MSHAFNNYQELLSPIHVVEEEFRPLDVGWPADAPLVRRSDLEGLGFQIDEEYIYQGSDGSSSVTSSSSDFSSVSDHEEVLPPIGVSQRNWSVVAEPSSICGEVEEFEEDAEPYFIEQQEDDDQEEAEEVITFEDGDATPTTHGEPVQRLPRDASPNSQRLESWGHWRPHSLPTMRNNLVEEGDLSLPAIPMQARNLNELTVNTQPTTSPRTRTLLATSGPAPRGSWYDEVVSRTSLALPGFGRRSRETRPGDIELGRIPSPQSSSTCSVSGDPFVIDDPWDKQVDQHKEQERRSRQEEPQQFRVVVEATPRDADIRGCCGPFDWDICGLLAMVLCGLLMAGVIGGMIFLIVYSTKHP